MEMGWALPGDSGPLGNHSQIPARYDDRSEEFQGAHNLGPEPRHGSGRVQNVAQGQGPSPRRHVPSWSYISYGRSRPESTE